MQKKEREAAVAAANAAASASVENHAEKSPTNSKNGKKKKEEKQKLTCLHLMALPEKRQVAVVFGGGVIPGAAGAERKPLPQTGTIYQLNIFIQTV